MTETMETVIRTRNLSKDFKVGFWQKRVPALRGVDLEVRKNEIMGFLGPNGAGKTTTIKILLGIIHKSGGEGEILGAPVGDVKVKNKVGFLPEQPYFYDYLTGREFLDFYARFHGLSGSERKARIDEMFELVGLTKGREMPLRKYSKGMLQRIGMAQALLGDPELAILDEPMSGLDPFGRRDMREIILGLKERGKTVFLSSHILPDVEEICDRVTIINQGKVIDTGRLDEILDTRISMVDLQFAGLDQAGLQALRSLSEKWDGLRVIEKGGLALVTTPGFEAADEVEQRGRELGGRLVSLNPQRETLEEYFVREIGEQDGKGGRG